MHLNIVRIATGLMFLAFFLLGPGTEAPAQNKTGDIKWERYDTDETGVKYSYDKGSISYPTPSTLQLWRQRIFPLDAAYENVITLDQIDCDKQKYRTIEINVTNKDGSTEEFKKVSQWAYIYVGMPEDYFLRELCKQK